MTKKIPRIVIVGSMCLVQGAWAGQTIDCNKPPAGSIETMICQDAGLMALDRQMAAAYAAATKRAKHERPPVLKAGQRGWIKGRNDCWKADDKRACVVESYQLRLVELQTRYRLVTPKAPVRYICNGNPADEVVATYFPTEPPAMIAERGDQTSLMLLQPSASGSRYVGRNESLWEHQGEATVVWGYQAPEMRCQKVVPPAAPELAGSAWQLIAIHSMDDAQGTVRIDQPERYTMHFDNEGRVRLRIDCNRGFATWTAKPSAEAVSGSLEFGPIATTRMACPADTHDQRVARDLPHVRSYLFKDGKLHLSLKADGGIYEWAPLPGTRR